MTGKALEFAKFLFHVASRGAERILPPIALWFVMWPLTQVVGARRARRSRERVPAAHLPLPADSKPPSLLRRWRHFSREQSHWWLLGWLDRLSDDKWQRRLNTHGLEQLTTVLAERPVIICTIHTTSVLTLAAWLRSLGIPAAHVPMDLTWFSSSARKRKVALAQRMGAPLAIRPDSPHDMIEFLTPGHALVLTADFTAGRTIAVPWGAGSVVVATGLFRLARATGAAVVPAIIFSTGRWRYEVTAFEPVPQDLINAGDTTGAARHVVDCLLPPAAARPDQAMEVLLATVS